MLSQFANRNNASGKTKSWSSFAIPSKENGEDDGEEEDGEKQDREEENWEDNKEEEDKDGDEEK